LVASLTVGLLLALWGGWGWLRPEAAPSELPVAFRLGLSDFQVRAQAGSTGRLAISRDGSHIAVASYVDGTSKLFLRSAGQREFEEIPGTDGAREPDFSPDGTWLVFWQDNQINRVEVSGGPILPVTEGDFPHWGLDGMLVFEGLNGGIYRVSPFGGDPVLIRDQVSQSFPHLLPDGQAIVFQGQADGAAGTRIMLVEIESGEVVDLGIRGGNPRYVPTGHLVYGHQDQVLMAVSFDLETHRVTGQPSTVLPSVLVYGGGATQFEVSETGTAVYGLSSGGGGGNEFVIVDLEGGETTLPLPGGQYAVPRFSPDGRRIAYDNGTSEIGVYNLDTGANPMIASGVQDDPDVPATWSRDGRYVYFESVGPGTLGSDVFRQLADGSADPEHLLRREGIQYPLSTSPDDTQLLVVEQTTDRGLDLLIVTEGQDTATPYLVAPWDESMGVISPDGTMVAYVSNESGVPEVYIRSFPDAANQVLVSEAGGTEPVWARPNGEAVYYRNRNELWRAEITGDGVGERRMLFEAPYNGPFLEYNTNWDVHPDGSSFVFVKGPGGAGDDGGPPVIPIEIVTNWFEELRARLEN